MSRLSRCPFGYNVRPLTTFLQAKKQQHRPPPKIFSTTAEMSGPSDKSASAAEASTTNPYTKYYNSPTLSDVVICYGDNGERVFYGHKLQLSAKAQWFENAFTHGFAETGADKVTLHEDDPAAVEGMLKHIYGKQLIDLDCTGIEDVFFAIGLYRIADKCDCPSLETEAPDLLGRLVAKFFDQLHIQEEMSGINDLYKIVSAVYDFEETRSGSKRSPILRSLISCIFANNAAKPFEGSQVLSKAISKVAERIPEFGRDMYMGMLDVQNCFAKREGHMPLVSLVYKTKCSSCGSKRGLSISCGAKGHCWNCGVFKDDWKSRRVSEGNR
ncbi:hypothetical protein HBI55_026180 [Parastagonospora nodorum]|nr:hypothetical protein HBI55_026180 [Parastagonospora nodorum]